MSGSKHGHSENFRYLDCILDNPDHCIAEPFSCGSFSALWWRRDAASFFMDESKLRGRVGWEVFYRELSIISSFKLAGYCSIFQAEVAAIKVPVDFLLRSATSFREVYIYLNSRMTILAVSSLMVRSRLVKGCLTSLSIASSNFVNRNVWVPG